MHTPYWQIGIYLKDANGADVGSMSPFGAGYPPNDASDTPGKGPAFSFLISTVSAVGQTDPEAMYYAANVPAAQTGTIAVNSEEFLSALESSFSGLDWTTLYGATVTNNYPLAVLPVSFSGMTVQEVDLTGTDIYNTVVTS